MWAHLAIAGFAGLGIGVGLVVGVALVRLVRRKLPED